MLQNFKITENITESFHHLEINGHLAVAASLEEFKNDRSFINSVYCFDDFHKIHESFLNILMRLDFPLVNELNLFIQQAADGGLLFKWLKSKVYIEKSSEFQYIQIDIQTESIVLIIWAGMATFSFLMWIIEKIVYKKVRAPNSSRFWRYIEMAIDPYRHFLNGDFS